MRIAHLSDLHVRRGARLEEQRQILGRVLAGIKERECDLALLTGDFYGKIVPYLSHPEEREVLLEFASALSEVCPSIYVYGNHDFPGDIDSVRLVAGLHPIHVVRGASVIPISTPVGKATVFALAFPRPGPLLDGDDAPGSPEDRRRAMSQKVDELMDLWGDLMRDAPLPVLAAHATVRGSRTSGGEVLAGTEIELTRGALERMPLRYGALGHIHLRQSPAERCWYPGSLWPTDFGEREDKGFHVVYLDEPVAPAGSDPLGDDDSVEWVPTRAPKMITLTWAWSAQGDRPIGWLAEPAQTPDQVAGHHLRLRLESDRASIDTCPWDDHIAPFIAVAASVKIERLIAPIVSVRSPAVTNAVGPVAKLDAYWQTLDAPPTPAIQAASFAHLETMLDRTDDADVLASIDAMLEA